MNLAGKTVLVTGATGFLGGALTRGLAAKGAQVRAPARNPQRASYVQDVANVEIVVGDILDATRMVELAQGCTYVFHVAAATNGPLDRQRAVNGGGIHNVALAAVEAGVGRLVHVSSIAVYGYRYEGTVTEEMPPQPGRDAYNISKTETEAALRDLAEQHRLEYSIIRPGMIYGPRSGVWTGAMFRLARLRPIPWFGPGTGSIQPIHVDDVVEQMLIQATHPNAANETFNAAPDPPPSWREFLSHYARLAGHERWLGLPPALGHIATPAVEAVLSLRGDPKDLPELSRYIHRRTVYSMDKARRMLDWEPQIDLASGIESCIPWLRAQGLLR